MKKVTFVNIDYDGLQIANYGDDYPVEDDWPFLVEELCAAGYKVTISTSNNGTGKSATITDKREKSINEKFILSAWGSSVPSAIAKAAFAVSEAERLKLNWFDYKSTVSKESQANLENYKEFMEWKRSQEKK